MKIWFLHVEGQTIGPFSRDEIVGKLAAGEISWESPAWREPLRDWVQLHQAEEFKASVGQQPAPAMPPAYAPAPSTAGVGATAVSQPADQKSTDSPAGVREWSKPQIIGASIAGVVILVVAIAIIANSRDFMPFVMMAGFYALLIASLVYLIRKRGRGNLTCLDCNRVITPKKEFNWTFLIFSLLVCCAPGGPYLIYFAFIKPARCPICNGTNFQKR